MNELQQFLETYPWFLPTIIIFSIWETVWKLIALWKAGRNNQLVWFICIAIINTAGILPIVYILIQRNKQQEKVM
jgi:hypothetical protein